MRASHRKTILFAILAGIVALVVWDQVPGQRSSSSPAVDLPRNPDLAQAGGVSGKTDDSLRALTLELPQRQALGEPLAPLFDAPSWQPPAPKVAARPPAPVAPPMPYRFAGRLVQDGRAQVFLSKGDVTVPITQGEVLEGTYRVETITEDRITLVYVPLGIRESIPAGTVASTDGTLAPPTAGRLSGIGSRETAPTGSPVKPARPATGPLFPLKPAPPAGVMNDGTPAGKPAPVFPLKPWP